MAQFGNAELVKSSFDVCILMKPSLINRPQHDVQAANVLRSR